MEKLAKKNFLNEINFPLFLSFQIVVDIQPYLLKPKNKTLDTLFLCKKYRKYSKKY